MEVSKALQEMSSYRQQKKTVLDLSSFEPVS